MKRYYIHPKLSILLIPLLMLLTTACDKFDYSPYEIRLDEDEKNINNRNLQRIAQLNISPTDTFKFVLTSDTQGFYEENEKLVAHINQRNDISFVLLGGDITDFGLVKEFKLVHEDFKKLKVPYVAVVGNHDAINNGKEAFSAIYGDYDFSFPVGNTKFILLNTNYLEFDKKVPNLEWLEKELQAAAVYENTIVVAHISPTSPEFGAEKSQRYADLLKQYHADFSLHGHGHSFKFHYPFGEELPILESASTEKLEYIVFTVAGENVSFERIKI